jgi:hypothetical protein
MSVSGFGGLGDSALAFGTQVRGFKPGRSRLIFQGEKNPQRAFLRKGSKTVGPMSLIPRRFVEVGVSARAEKCTKNVRKALRNTVRY